MKKKKMEILNNLRNLKRFSKSPRLRPSNQRPKGIPSKANRVLENTDRFGTMEEKDGTLNGKREKTDFGKLSS